MMSQRLQNNSKIWRQSFSSGCFSSLAITMLLPFTTSFISNTSSPLRGGRGRSRERRRAIHSLSSDESRFSPIPSSRYFSTTRLNQEAKHSKHEQHTRLISFVTDIEGDKAYFDRFVETSRILQFQDVEPNFAAGLDYFPYDKRVIFHHSQENDNYADITTTTTTTMQHDESIKNDSQGVDSKKSILIFGGDVGDKGGNDLYVIRQLLSLKKRYEKRVHFIMGNRDINKMRILQELGITSSSSASAQEKLTPHGGINWFRGTGLQGDADLIRQYNTRLSDNGEKDILENILVSDIPSERLKWILRKTMGSPDAFEYRRHELKEEKEFIARYEGRSDHNTNVSDEEVVESYRTACHPKHGIMGAYLSEAKLCLKIGGAMFMHGALPITPEAILQYEHCISASKSDITRTEAKARFWAWFLDYATPFAKDAPVSTSEWTDRLNAFAKEQGDAWKRNVTITEAGGRRPDESVEEVGGILEGEDFWCTTGGYQKGDEQSDLAVEFGSLCQYGMGWLPDRSKNPTIVYDSWMQDGMPRYYSENENASYKSIIEDFFDFAGLDVIVAGHQPVGDIPFPIRIGKGLREAKKFIICADTSYSGNTKWMGMDKSNRKNIDNVVSLSGRGDVCVSEILLEQYETGGITSVISHGTLSDGEGYESANLLSDGEDIIGREADRDKFAFEGSVQDDSCDEVKWFVKTKFLDGGYLLSTGKGYEVFNSIGNQKT